MTWPIARRSPRWSGARRPVAVRVAASEILPFTSINPVLLTLQPPTIPSAECGTTESTLPSAARRNRRKRQCVDEHPMHVCSLRFLPAACDAWQDRFPRAAACVQQVTACFAEGLSDIAVSYTHLRAHETGRNLV